MIVIWSGAIVDIPHGWGLCDGSQGTPDLRGRFVVAAGGAYNPGATGGSSSHTHPFTGDGHTHTIPGGADIAAGTDYDHITGSGNVTGTTDVSSHQPPYHALCYIMKL